MLLVEGDNLGNSINVFADSSGHIQVTERGAAVTIRGSAPTTSNVKLVVEEAGKGANNTLSTGPSLGRSPTP